MCLDDETRRTYIKSDSFMKILVVNAGSSSHKLALYDLVDEEPVEPLWEGSLDCGRSEQRISLKIKSESGTVDRELNSKNEDEGLKILLASLWQGPTQVIENSSSIEAIGHRVVHGGAEFEQPTLIDQSVTEQIRRLIPLAPLHNPASLRAIEFMKAYFPLLPQIAVFDTAFHLTMPELVKTYPVPLEWKEKGIQRYGFHGISHHYCAERAARLLSRNPAELKIINCHLGNGCSLCAIKDGKSVETTMGLTPLEGLMMGTRSGSIDPGILLFLMKVHQMPIQELDDALNFESGLKAIGGSSDMRALLDGQDETMAHLAIQMFVHRLKASIGALAASLEGFNVLSFTAGIGENAAPIREAVCRGLSFLNLAVDFEKNLICTPDAVISTHHSTIHVLVMHTREDWMIARACLRLL